MHTICLSRGYCIVWCHLRHFKFSYSDRTSTYDGQTYGHNVLAWQCAVETCSSIISLLQLC